MQGKQVHSENAVRFLVMKIDHMLSFDDQISDLCRKAKEILAQSFICSNLLPSGLALLWKICEKDLGTKSL